MRQESPETKLPDILFLSALNAVERGDGLVSPKLTQMVEEYMPQEGAMWQAYETAEAGSLEELSEARRLADYFLLRTSEKLQNNPKDELLWSERFNEYGDDMYGTVDPAEAVKIIAGELSEISAGAPESHAARTYRKLAKGAVAEFASVEPENFGELKHALFDHFHEIVENIAELPEGPYSSADIRGVFEHILQQMAQTNPAWAEWEVTNPAGNTMLAVVKEKKQIEVPDGRADVETKQKLLGLSLHELGVHATRAVNGAATGDKLMEMGLPDYIDFEEGLGILFEYIATGEVPSKEKDRYVDTALATGAIEGVRLTRQQLKALATSRVHARSLGKTGKRANYKTTKKDVNSHVNRLFRGGSGLPISNEAGDIISQAVYVKDMVYYIGFVKARKFVIEQLASGVEPEKLISYLLVGKFDATNELHIAHLAKKHEISI